MFGHHDDNSQPQDNHDNGGADEPDQAVPQDNEQAADNVDELVIKPGENGSGDQTPGDGQAQTSDEGQQSPSASSDDDKRPGKDVISPAGGFPEQHDYQPVTGQADSDQPAGNEDDKELAGVRKQALNDLSPIIDRLDLSPEEKFRLLMMLIQSNDDRHLVKQAYEAAHSIEDDKVRAQALYDVVNEINYFTAPSEAKVED